MSTPAHKATPAQPAGLSRIGTPNPTREKHPRYVWLAVAFAAVFASLFGYLYLKAGSKVPVVVVTSPVAMGHTIQRTDLSTISVSGDVAAMPAASLSSIVGETAQVPLLPGQLLLSSMVGSGDALPAGMTEVGLSLKGGSLPADGLAAGETVEVVALPPANPVAGQPTTPTVVVPAVRVFSSHQDPNSASSTLVTLVVPLANAPAVANDAASGLVALVKVPAP